VTANSYQNYQMVNGGRPARIFYNPAVPFATMIRTQGKCSCLTHLTRVVLSGIKLSVQGLKANCSQVVNSIKGNFIK
jgi:hypothetical protein